MAPDATTELIRPLWALGPSDAKFSSILALRLTPPATGNRTGSCLGVGATLIVVVVRSVVVVVVGATLVVGAVVGRVVVVLGVGGLSAGVDRRRGYGPARGRGRPSATRVAELDGRDRCHPLEDGVPAKFRELAGARSGGHG